MKRHLASLLILILSAALFAADEHAMLDLAKVQEIAKGATREKFPDAEDVMIDDIISITYQKDGSSVTWDDTCVKILTDKGVRNNRTLGAGYNISYAKAFFTTVEIIKPNGQIIPIDIESNSKEMVSSGQMDSNIYNPNSKTLRVGVPGLEVGDILHYIKCTQVYNSRMPGLFCHTELFEYSSPMMNYTVKIDGPADHPLRSIALKDEIPGTVTHEKKEENGRILYKWTVKDVPRMFSEPNMPSLSRVVQRLGVSTAASWKEVSQWFWKINAQHFIDAPEIIAKVKELCKDAKNEDQKIQAIFKFVSQEIRYMGITLEKDAPGYEPHDITLTFNNRHGVCRDKAGLLVAMLRMADIDAYPVLIDTGPLKDAEYPLPYFNHAITAVRRKSGEYIFMDSTNETTKELFPAYLCHRSIIIGTPEGEDLRISPITPAEKNMMEITTNLYIDDKGDLTGESFFKFNGYNDNSYRATMARRTPEKQREFFESIVKNIAPGTRLIDMELKPADVSDTSVPLSLRLTFAADSIMIDNGKVSMLKIPSFFSSVGSANSMLGSTTLEKRKYPMMVRVACGIHETINATFDPVWGGLAYLPSYPKVDCDTMLKTCKVSFKNDTLTQESTYAIKTVEFSPEQYLELKKNRRRFGGIGKMPIFDRSIPRKKPVIKKEPTVKKVSDQPESDFELLDSLDVYTFTDPCHWHTKTTVRRKILTYKGKKDFSELKLNYAPARESVKLNYARVINGDKVQNISEQEQNIMDASWVAGAPKYDPTKILVCSLPGVEIGSIIEYEYEYDATGTWPFQGSFIFQDYAHVAHNKLVINVPENLPLYAKFHSGGWLVKTKGFENIFKSTSETKNGIRKLTWEAYDLPAIARENDLPSFSMFTPCVEIGFGDWKRHAEEVFSQMKRHTLPGEKVRELAEELRQKDDVATIRAVRDKVMKSIRIAGPYFNYLSYSNMSNAEATLRDGYGNPCDRGILMFSILSYLGFKPEFALANPTVFDKAIDHDRERFRYNGWNRVLVHVRHKGQDYWLNDAGEYAELPCTSYDDRSVLLENGKFATINVPKEYKTRTTFDGHVTLNNDGSADVTDTYYYYGMDHSSKKRFFTEQTPEARRRYHQELVSNFSTSANAVGELVTDFTSYPGKMSYTVHVAYYSTKAGDYMYIKSGNPLSGYMNPRADTRISPIYWSSHRQLDNHIRFDLPPKFADVVMIPKTLNWKTPTKHGWLSRIVKTDKKGYDLYYKADMDPEIVPAAYYKELMDMARTLRHPSFTTLLLKKVAEPVKKEAEQPKKEAEQPKKDGEQPKKEAAAPEKKAA